jgi:hypothetical protein
MLMAVFTAGVFFPRAHQSVTPDIANLYNDCCCSYAHTDWGLINLCSNKSSKINRGAPMTNAQEKRVKRIAEHKGFRLDKAGHGKGHGRFYIMNLAEGGRMRSGIPDHEYSFSLEEADAWLDTYVK